TFPVMRRPLACLALLLTGFWSPLLAQQGVTEQLESWYAAAREQAPGLWGVVVADEKGEVLWSVNGSEPMVPASTVKLLTTGFARSVVGSEARRPTRVVGTGGVGDDGTWQGSWALELNGDPTFGRPSIGGPTLQMLAEQLRSIGVRRLTGPLELTSTAGPARSRYPAAWPSRHRGRYYAPPIGPITINENLVSFSVAPAGRRGEKPEITVDIPSGSTALITNKATTAGGRTNRLAIRTDGDGWVITGTIGVNASPRRYTFVAHNPAAVMAAAWDAALARAGIVWDRNSKPTASEATTSRLLAEVVSPTFDEIATEVNRRSVNLGAELMLLWGAGPDDGPKRLERHVRSVTGIADGIRLVDGSGLADSDRIAPVVFTSYLAAYPRTASGADFPLLLPANGSGTLRNLNDGTLEDGVVRAKTGSINNVTTLVGYLGRPDGKLLVAAMYNGSNTTRARQAQWDLFRTLGADGVVIPPSDGGDDPIELPLGGEPVDTR
ncbi:MAG TPA: D-alanyl-D-alanine carboxypeptidase/D-alanyl-D-alanine-endopeptidase, partial [Gemmatimonadales bacterium]|nr:D-alanyl-D-alanine carboxypeptidase/D-alanyl-D-alanine-endopeptidase [Gemmatimonadales bacterium]